MKYEGVRKMVADFGELGHSRGKDERQVEEHLFRFVALTILCEVYGSMDQIAVRLTELRKVHTDLEQTYAAMLEWQQKRANGK
jgi:hypothetical protein